MFQISDFARRPGIGHLGRAIKVRTNFFEVKSLPDANIHHYTVKITPEVPPVLNRKVYNRFEELYSESLGRIKPVYDGRNNLYTSRPLPFGDTATFNVILPEDDGAPAGQRPPRCFKVTIKKVAEINMEEINRFFNGNCSISNNILTG